MELKNGLIDRRLGVDSKIKGSLFGVDPRLLGSINDRYTKATGKSLMDSPEIKKKFLQKQKKLF